MGKIEHCPCTQAPRRDPQLSSAHGCQWKLLRVRGLQGKVPGTPPVRKCKLLHMQLPLVGLGIHSAAPSLLPSEVGCSVRSKARGSLAQARPGCFCCGGAWVLNTHFQGQIPPPPLSPWRSEQQPTGAPARAQGSAGRCHWCVRVCLFAAQACVCVCACFSVGSLQFCCLSAPSALDSSPLHGFVSLPVLQQPVSFSPHFALWRQLWSQGLCLCTPLHVNNMQHNSASYRSVH